MVAERDEYRDGTGPEEVVWSKAARGGQDAVGAKLPVHVPYEFEDRIPLLIWVHEERIRASERRGHGPASKVEFLNPVDLVSGYERVPSRCRRREADGGRDPGHYVVRDASCLLCKLAFFVNSPRSWGLCAWQENNEKVVSWETGTQANHENSVRGVPERIQCVFVKQIWWTWRLRVRWRRKFSVLPPTEILVLFPRCVILLSSW